MGCHYNGGSLFRYFGALNMDLLNGTTIVVLLLLIALVVAAIFLVRTWRSKPAASQVHVHGSIEEMRAIGDLSVYKVFTKEIVTETDHSWGEFGSKYLGWLLSKKKMAMIFEFEIEFHYNLRSNAFAIANRGPGRFQVTLPPCQHNITIRDIHLYDEQKAKVLPWLLPDLLNGFLTGGFNEADKNKLIAAARLHAEDQARVLIKKLESDLHQSAERTLRSIARGFGATDVTFAFSDTEQPAMVIEIDNRVAA
jgi:hypothetical protein